MTVDVKERRKHPSGKPIHPRKFGTQNYYRQQLDGPLNPRLRHRDLVSAIGFHRQIVSAVDEDE